MTDWIPGLAVGAAALGAGLVATFLGRKSVRPPSTRRAAQLTYAQTIAALREHSTNAHLFSPEDWAAEKERLEAQAVDLLRSTALASDSPVAGAEAPSARRGLVGFAASALAVLALGATLAWAVVENLRPPPTPAPQDMAAAPKDVALDAALAAVDAHPDDLAVLNRAASMLLVRQNMSDAAQVVFHASALDPFNLPARVYRTVLSAADAPQQTVAELERLADLYPSAVEGHLYAGLIAAELGDRSRAVARLTRFQAEAPPELVPPFLEQVLSQLNPPAAP